MRDQFSLAVSRLAVHMNCTGTSFFYLRIMFRPEVNASHHFMHLVFGLIFFSVVYSLKWLCSEVHLPSAADFTEEYRIMTL